MSPAKGFAMRSYEANVESRSDYYVYTASTSAKKLFFYPLHIGYFYYEPNYHLKRDSFDSFLILLVTKGSCEIHLNNTTPVAHKGEVVLLDCYSPHEYGSPDTWEASWLHFDGPLAREYYEHIVQASGNIIIPRSPQTVGHSLNKICGTFRSGAPLREASLSKYILNILTELLLAENKIKTAASPHAAALENTIAYINEHFAEPLSLKDLAAGASLSPFYFTRVFARETGMTPHQYLIATRLNSAKFLLKSTDISIKEIAFNSGFTSESSFCSTFKKWEHITPSEYRSLDSMMY